MKNNQSAINRVIEHGIDIIKDGEWEGEEASELHDHLYNEDYCIIGYYQAEQFLNEYNVFDAIRLVQDYEKDNFGEYTTDLSDVEKVANMVFYIVGEEVLNNCKTLASVWDKKLTSRSIKAIQEELEAQIIN